MGFESIGVNSGYSPQNASAATPPTTHFNVPPATPNVNDNMWVHTGPAAISTPNAAYSFFPAPPVATQMDPAAPTMAFNPGAFSSSPLPNPVYNHASSSAPNQLLPVPGIPTTPPAAAPPLTPTLTPSRPNKPPPQKPSWGASVSNPYRQR